MGNVNTTAVGVLGPVLYSSLGICSVAACLALSGSSARVQPPQETRGMEPEYLSVLNDKGIVFTGDHVLASIAPS